MLQYKNTGKEHYNVLIATPGRTMASEYVRSLTATIKFLDSSNISWTYTNQYSPIISNAREATLCDSNGLDISNPNPGLGKFTYDKIFLIDSDIVWSPEHFMRLYTSEKDAISGIYYDQYGRNAVVHLAEDSNRPMTREEVSARRDIFSVYGTGLGFFCIKKGILENLKRPWFPLGKMTINSDGQNYEIPVGEDLYFCDRITKMGHQVWVDPNVSLGHVKTNIIF